MEQHPVPRNISGFQFHLIGDMTLRQFGYLAAGVGGAYFIFKLAPFPSIISLPMAGFVGLAGFAFAFLPIQERPLDKWLVAFIKSITSPTQYLWIKNNPPPDVLLRPAARQQTVVQPMSTAHQEANREAKQKLAAYLATLPQAPHEALNLRERNYIRSTLSLFQTSGAFVSGTPYQPNSQKPSYAPRIQPIKYNPKSGIDSVRSGGDTIPSVPIANRPAPASGQGSQSVVQISKPGAGLGNIIKTPVTPPPKSSGTATHISLTADRQQATLKSDRNAFNTPPEGAGYSKTEPSQTPVAAKTVQTVKPATSAGTKPESLNLQSATSLPAPTANKIYATLQQNPPEVKMNIPKTTVPVSTDNLQNSTSGTDSLQKQQVKEAQQPTQKPQNDSTGSDTLQKQLASLAAEKKMLEAELNRLRNERLDVNRPQVVKPEAGRQEVKKEPTITAIPSKAAAAEMGFTNLNQNPNIIAGVFKDPGRKILPNIILTIKDKQGSPLRAMKTNKLGQFATATPLPNGVYFLEADDPLKRYVFDIAEITLNGKVFTPVEIIAKGEKELMREKLNKAVFGNVTM